VWHALGQRGRRTRRRGFRDGIIGASTDSLTIEFTPVRSQQTTSTTPGEVHDPQFDTGPFRAFADRVKQYYAGLSERRDREADDRPEDRTFMYPHGPNKLVFEIACYSNFDKSFNGGTR